MNIFIAVFSKAHKKLILKRWNAFLKVSKILANNYNKFGFDNSTRQIKVIFIERIERECIVW